MPYTVSWLRTKRNPALLPGQWITLRKSAPRRGKQATFRPERKPPTTLDSACRPHPGPTSPPLPRPASSTQRRRRAAPPGVHRPPHAWSPCARRLQPVIGHVRAGSPARPGALPRSRWQRWGSRSLASAPSQEVRTAAAGASGPAPPQSGQRDRGLRAPPPLRPWLRVPLGSAPLGSGTCASGAAAPSSSASPGGQLLPAARRAFEPPSPVYGFPRQENFASVPTSISRPLPPRLPVGARAHTHTHTHTRRRACARPRARSRGISGAATHTGFQPPLGVLCLQQRRPRRRRGRRLQPGPVSELGAQDRVRGEAEKEGAEARRSRAAPAPGAAAPGTVDMPSSLILMATFSYVSGQRKAKLQKIEHLVHCHSR
ncbi:mucin-1-like [Bos indicus x Bos taurus]|uniref:mucin-1-like n=1 Tax=Bos indicus x Bos taurus TaxID=30522 RepID=UPI000F7D585B|nr:mucin-1-like [Bos indicus x Bos taurus]